MKWFGRELKFNGFDIWTKGNLTKLSELINDLKYTVFDIPDTRNTDLETPNSSKWNNQMRIEFKPGSKLGLPGAWYSTFIIKGWTGDYQAVQIAVNATNSNNKDIFYRVGLGATWDSTWVKLYHEGNKPTPSDIGAAEASHVHDAVYEPKNDNIQAHIGNVSNPHTVTKSQVGLGSVSNYGLATQAEAEAGTSSVKYMTPLRVKQAIDKFKPTKLSEFENDIGAGCGIKITTSATAPTSPSPGDFWYKII